MVGMLEAAFQISVYHWSTEESWFDNYAPDTYDLIFLDEFKGQKKIQQLNPILSGDSYPMIRRGRPPLIYRDNLPVIICANQLPHQIYHKVCSSEYGRVYIDSLTSRLEIVSVDFGGRIELEPVLPDLSPTGPDAESIDIESISDYEPTFTPDQWLEEDDVGETILPEPSDYDSEEFSSSDSDPDYFEESVLEKYLLHPSMSPNSYEQQMFHPNPYWSPQRKYLLSPESEPESEPELEETPEIRVPRIFSDQAKEDNNKQE